MPWRRQNLWVLLLFYLVLGSSEAFSGSSPELSASSSNGNPPPHRRELEPRHLSSGGQGSAIQRGRDIWFNNTYGGEKFFDFLAYRADPGRRLQVGSNQVLNTPRDRRFQTWGTLNDPDCRANPRGGPDLCSDPHASGVIGIRRFRTTEGRTIFGLSCASCHAGFDPLNPPVEVNEPRWENIHPTIGNQHLKAGKILAANLPTHDPRRLMLEAWPDGTVDTTVLFSGSFPDKLMNPVPSQ